MSMNLILAVVIILAVVSILDLIVGVSNDAANFLNSSLGSKVAPRNVILGVASLGLLCGVTFSSGMMEVARKGIFHPELFELTDLLVIFVSVMLGNILLLDIFNTYGLPTSTTVAIVFALLGAAVAVSMFKLADTGERLTDLVNYINTAKAMMIIFGILLSVVMAFFVGMIVQFCTRVLFTFDYRKRLMRYGALWGGLAMAAITYFILIKGAKGSSFLTEEKVAWIATHTRQLLLYCFAVSAVLMQVLLLARVNILKIIILIGTFALAMAFAANDLVNFIGVPMAGFNAYKLGAAGRPMSELAGKVPAHTGMLLLAGAIMAVTLWVSRKARTVSKTEIGLSRQEEGTERFDSTALSRAIVRTVINLAGFLESGIPKTLKKRLSGRFEPLTVSKDKSTAERPSYDLIRASVNLMVAGAVISFATSFKLPLSTTYVTFMVAMGTSFADMAWGRESAVYRVTGVLTVIGGWFLTAISVFIIAGIFAAALYRYQVYGGAALMLFIGFMFWKNHHIHKRRSEALSDDKVFNLDGVEDINRTLHTVLEHSAHFVHETNSSLTAALDGLFTQDIYKLNREKARLKKIQRWANIIVANILKSMRFVQRHDVRNVSLKYAQTVRRIQKLADGHRDIVQRAHVHVSNHHKGMLPVQVDELRETGDLLQRILHGIEAMLRGDKAFDFHAVSEQDRQLQMLARKFGDEQAARIKDENSKTRLTILFYAVLGNALMISKQAIKLVKIFKEGFATVEKDVDFELE